MTKKNQTNPPTTDTDTDAPQPVILKAVPKARKARGQSDEVIARWAMLDGMAETSGEVTVHEYNEDGEPVTDDAGEPVVLQTFARAFLATGEMLGVKDASVPVTIAAWAKDRGIATSVVTRYGYPVVVLTGAIPLDEV